MSEPETKNEKINAGVLRQLISSFYDGLLLLAVLLIATALTVPLTQAGLISPDNPLISLYLLLVCFLFFAWFWVHGGQTLGMHVWHIRIEQFDGSLISWKQASIRFLSGLPAWGILVLCLVRFYVPETFQIKFFPAGLISLNPTWLLIIGSIWLVIDHWDVSWRDKISGTHMIVKK
ncbi:MAG: RDD family protein [Gammaproteobacteria bacterium]|nr:RDD family protein [Gammaproteobacteria bacterium]